ncbi:putative DNA mismatch repair protein MutS, clamp [Dioscorea sansibarensis]
MLLGVLFCDISKAMQYLANKYCEECKLPNLKIPFNSRQGFFFSIPQKDQNRKLPGKFMQVMKHGKNIHCSTFEFAYVSNVMLPFPLSKLNLLCMTNM